MTLDLRGKKVVVISGKHSIGRAIAEAVAREGADVLINNKRPTAAVQWSNANLALAPSDGPETLLVIQLDNAKTSRLKDSLE
jgi:NAD(P)-dependent dehydrogenase (short-subunit alcohol dehydrogenase family)